MHEKSKRCGYETPFVSVFFCQWLGSNRNGAATSCPLPRVSRISKPRMVLLGRLRRLHYRQSVHAKKQVSTSVVIIIIIIRVLQFGFLAKRPMCYLRVKAARVEPQNCAKETSICMFFLVWGGGRKSVCCVIAHSSPTEAAEGWWFWCRVKRGCFGKYQEIRNAGL